MYMDTKQKKETRHMEGHYHVRDLMEALQNAQRTEKPVYVAEGPCGGCDLIIDPKPIDVKRLIQRLMVANPLKPVYPCESAPCGGCDLCLPCEGTQPRVE